MFEMSQLRCFVAVAEELHFNRAANRLNMTQPPLSRQIRLLEHHVGAELLSRSSRKVQLTAAGRSFLPEAARLLRLAQEAASTARRVAKGEAGTLAIGFTAGTGYSLLPELVRLVRENLPGVTLNLRESFSANQLEALANGQLDLGFVRPHVRHPALDSIELVREDLVLAIPEADAANWPEVPSVADLQGKPFLQYAPFEGLYFHNLVNRELEGSGVTTSIVEYVPQIHTMLALVQAGLGVALIPETATQLHFDRTVIRRYQSRLPKSVVTCCSFRRDNDSPSLQLYVQALLRRFRPEAAGA
jgi:DNA-binding transcriptional LysR family regulator